MPSEVCATCGANGGSHPIVAMVALSELPSGIIPLKSNSGWAALSICGACHRDPAHRSRKIKAHFFGRAQLDQALTHAGSESIGG